MMNRVTVRQHRVLAVFVLIGMFFGSHFVDSQGVSLKAFQWHVTMTYTTAGIPVDKVVHFSCCSLLTFLTGRCGWVGSSAKRNLLAATLFVCLYGVFDEVTQGMMGRDCEVSDWLADAMAAWSVLLARWPMGVVGPSWGASLVRMVVCVAACLVAPAQAAISKLRGGAFSRSLIQEQQYGVLAGLVGVACVVMLVSMVRAKNQKVGVE